MQKYAVFYNFTGDSKDQLEVFLVDADDADHAREQLWNAYEDPVIFHVMKEVY